ncbi:MULTISPECIES: AraC family transcriptional regulator [unclassified Pseudonocardia]|uniref:AraC family transcriptional regulator n=1 Tax=unclassified Pseudonocardia TaxID=2619320 RepID=UPI000A8D3709|nr:MULTISPECIES: AraC family transcriptional regulator [unclassified Pseudonocardia]
MKMSVEIERSSFTSKSADEAWDALSRMYTRARPHTSSPEAALRVTSATTPAVALDRVWLHSAEGAFSESPEQVNVISVLSGRISLDFGRHGSVANTPGDSYLYLPDSPAHLEWDTFSALAVRLPLRQMARSAAGLTGLSLDALRFASMRPVSAAHAQLWLRTVKFAWRELTERDGCAGESLVHQELVNLVTTTALSVFPNTAADVLADRPAPGTLRAEPAALRRAVEFIETNAHRPIGLDEIGEAARIGSRGLQHAFRRHRDCTPVDYLRQVRMDRAHRDLQAADPTRGDTVAEIAARWGFGHAGRFAVQYRQRYGQSPGATLRN